MLVQYSFIYRALGSLFLAINKKKLGKFVTYLCESFSKIQHVSFSFKNIYSEAKDINSQLEKGVLAIAKNFKKDILSLSLSFHW